MLNIQKIRSFSVTSILFEQFGAYHKMIQRHQKYIFDAKNMTTALLIQITGILLYSRWPPTLNLKRLFDQKALFIESK